MKHEIPLTRGMILHARPFKETSLIAEVFLREEGRFSVVMKGAKRPKSPFKALAHPFTPLFIAAKGRGELLTATGLEPAGGRVDLQAGRLIYGLYLNEILVRLLPKHDPFPECYDLYIETLSELKERDDHGIQSLLRRFEYHLLKSLGYGIDLKHDANHKPIDPNVYYDFDIQIGLYEVNNQEKLCIQGQTLIDLGRDHFTEKGLQELKWLMRKMISHLMGGKSIQTRTLWVT